MSTRRAVIRGIVRDAYDQDAASAVLLDATLVRIMPAPAPLRPLGERNWWLSRLLRRLLHRILFEREVGKDTFAACFVSTPTDRAESEGSSS